MVRTTWSHAARIDRVCLIHKFMSIQEASRNADELLKAEEKEKKRAEKRRQKNKKVSWFDYYQNCGLSATCTFTD